MILSPLIILIKLLFLLINSRETNYEAYIAVQNELVAAYTELRNREATRLYGMTFTLMKDHLKDPNYSGDKDRLKEQIEEVRGMYPEKLSEAEPVTAEL